MFGTDDFNYIRVDKLKCVLSEYYNIDAMALK